MRHSTVAGKFYPEGRSELKKRVENLLSFIDDRQINLRAAVVPHAGYDFSGKCAAYAYRLIKNYDCFIILGTNHSGLGSKISLSIEDFETPLGIAENDIELVEGIMSKAVRSKLDIKVAEDAHKYEHSVEVQLPFLQITEKTFKIVPILLRDLSLSDIEKLGKIISEIIEKSEKRIFILASSDFTHYGKNYGFAPFTENIKEKLCELDKEAINNILYFNIPAFLESKATICGKDAVALCIAISGNLGLKAEKLCYYTSGDVLNKWDNVVGYASIGFY